MQLPMPSAPMLLDAGTMREIQTLLTMPIGDGRRNIRWAATERKTVSSGSKSGGATGVLPLTGILEQHQTFMGWLLGGTDLIQWGTGFAR